MMPEMASWALGRQKFVVGASRPYVIVPPDFGFPPPLFSGALAPAVPMAPSAPVSATTAPSATTRSHSLARQVSVRIAHVSPPKSIGTSAPPRPTEAPAGLTDQSSVTADTLGATGPMSTAGGPPVARLKGR